MDINKISQGVKKIPDNIKKRINFKLWLVVMLFSLTLIAGLFLYGNILAFLLLFDSIVKSIATAINLDIWLARIAAICLGLLFINLISPLIFTLNSRKRHVGYLFAGLIFVLIFFSAYITNRDFVFNPDGSAKKCMAWNPVAGQYDDDISCNWAVHPKYGTKVIPASMEMIAIKNTMENGPGEFKRITPHKNLRFFAPDGSPMIWYYQQPNGKVELFGNKGFHPQLQVILSPINGDVAALIIKYLEEKKYDMIVVDGKMSQIKSDSKQNDLSASGDSALQELRNMLLDLRR